MSSARVRARGDSFTIISLLLYHIDTFLYYTDIPNPYIYIYRRFNRFFFGGEAFRIVISFSLIVVNKPLDLRPWSFVKHIPIIIIILYAHCTRHTNRIWLNFLAQFIMKMKIIECIHKNKSATAKKNRVGAIVSKPTDVKNYCFFSTYTFLIYTTTTISHVTAVHTYTPVYTHVLLCYTIIQ